MNILRGLLLLSAGTLIATATPETELSPPGPSPASPAMVSSPHSTRAGRLVAQSSGITIEYSPGQEFLLQPLVDRTLAWHRELDALDAREVKLKASLAAPPPLSARDLRENRATILQEVARAIGLDAPTELQGRCYETMLDYYEQQSALRAVLAKTCLRWARVCDFTIWHKDELKRRLLAGEKIPGFSWDEKKQEGNYEFGLNINNEPSPEEKQRHEQAKAQRLDHSFNYTVDQDGLAHLAASFTLPRRTQTAAAAPAAPLASSYQASVDAFDRKLENQPSFIYPFVLTAKTAGTPAGELVDDGLKGPKGFVEKIERTAAYRDGPLAQIVLHETIEVGLVERYLGSADRRWICEGTANYLAWRIARDRAGPEFARQVYDLDAQLRRYAPLQKQIKLRKWPAVERQSKPDRDSELSQAHYAYATRALALMTQTQGDDLLPRLFRELGKTPRAKASMKTVATAYRRLTGNDLSALLKAAEGNPLPPAPPAPPADQTAALQRR